MSWPRTWRHWADVRDVPAVPSGSRVEVPLLRVQLPRPLGVALRGYVARRAGAPPAAVSWRISQGLGDAQVYLTHSTTVAEELEPGEFRLINGANVAQLQWPADYVEVMARITATNGDLAPGDVRVAAFLAPLGALSWEQGACDH